MKHPYQISLSDFMFIPYGNGRYRVTYTSSVSQKQWVKIINDMTIIDETKNCDRPKKTSLFRLKRICKS